MEISTSHYRLSSRVDYRKSHENTDPQEKRTAKSDNQSYHVSISKEAQDKLRNEKSTEESKPKDVIDQMIERVKERIRELKEKLQKLANDDSEQAQQKRKLIEQEIAIQNAVLMELLDTKQNKGK